MIRVNLLPVKRRKKKAPVPPFVFLMVLGILLTLLVVGILSYNLNGAIEQYTQQKQDNDAQLAELGKKIKEVEDFEANKRDFEAKLKVIEGLQDTQNAPIRLMNELVTRLTGGVWLESLNEQNWVLTVKGKGYTNAEIVTFVESLKSSEYLSEVVLEQTKRGTEEGVVVYTFRITMRMKV